MYLPVCTLYHVPGSSTCHVTPMIIQHHICHIILVVWCTHVTHKLTRTHHRIPPTMIRPPRSTTSCLLLLLLSFFTSDNLSLATSFSPQVFTPSRLGDRNVHRHYDNGEKRTERITPTTMYGLRGGGIGNNIQNVYGKYMSLLETSPISTKSITAGVVQALGDLLSQFIEAKVANVPFILNKYRLQGFLISGVFFVGPFLHYWYNFLWRIGDWAKNKLKAGKNMQTLLQVFTDQTLGVAIFFPLYFYVFELADALSSWRGTLVQRPRPLGFIFGSIDNISRYSSPTNSNSLTHKLLLFINSSCHGDCTCQMQSRDLQCRCYPILHLAHYQLV